MKDIRLYICILQCICLTGCKQLITGRNEITKIIFPGVVAIDISPENKENVALTISSKEGSKSKGGGSGKDGGGKETANIIHSQGRTVFEANRVLTTSTEKDIHWGHNEYIVIGEQAARDDVLKNLDFFIRNHENRLTVTVAIAAETTGDEIIEKLKVSDKSVSGKLDELFSDAGAMSLAEETKLSDLVESFNDKYSAAYIPCIQITNNMHESGEEQKNVVLQGVAVFKGASLLQFIYKKEARGLNWVTDKVESTLIVAEDIGGENVSLEVTQSKTDIKTKIEGDVPTVKIKVRVNSNIGEVYGRGDIFNKETITMLGQQQSDIVKDEIESIISFAKQNNVDILGFSDKLAHQHPVKWEKIKEKWEEIFPAIQAEVQVESEVNRVYNIKGPIRSREENEQ